ncbi:hypothetical protein F3087_31870 [Nocardia colli]|uniref:Leucine rich repeat variant domain-containing protein n=1 Tax=Nocardia colli TaxID=2545717 RepID=A0A5N0E938_9NOCA|nr:hypothetical protein [Nocardia colli]KAA8884959.1 hypothetical protein F3087_31870 [Nocardia colli]
MSGPAMHHRIPITLMPGETLRLSTRFSPYVILTHLTITLVVTDRRVVVRRPNTIFAVIPRGFLEQATPLAQVSEIATGAAVSTPHLFFGTGSLLAGLLSLFGVLVPDVAGRFVGLVLLGISAYLLLTSMHTGIWVRNHGGGVLRAPAGHKERRLVDEARKCLDASLFGDAATVSSSATTTSAKPPAILAATQSNPRRGFVPNSPTSHSASAATSAPDVRPDAVRAADPQSSPAALREIAQRWPGLRAVVAANPAANPGLLAWLGQLGDPDVDAALGGRT